jgi:hypothetical protein
MTQKTITDDLLSWTAFLPPEQAISNSQASGTLPVTAVCGAQECYLTCSGATALTLPSAAAVYAAIQALVAGVQVSNIASFNFYLRIINTNGGTLTLTAGTGNTITGTATLATETTRDFVVSVTSPNAATYTSVGTGTNS